MRSAAQTAAADATTVAPAARYSASVNPAVMPADFCTNTSPPSATQRRHRLGVIETRVSPILISLGTPIFMTSANEKNVRKTRPESAPPPLLWRVTSVRFPFLGLCPRPSLSTSSLPALKTASSAVPASSRGASQRIPPTSTAPPPVRSSSSGASATKPGLTRGPMAASPSSSRATPPSPKRASTSPFHSLRPLPSPTRFPGRL